MRLDFTGLYAKAAQFNLPVTPAKVLDSAIIAPAGQITGAVQSSELRVLNKFLGCENGIA
jgi:hypothetical protein